MIKKQLKPLLMRPGDPGQVSSETGSLDARQELSPQCCTLGGNSPKDQSRPLWEILPNQVQYSDNWFRAFNQVSERGTEGGEELF